MLALIVHFGMISIAASNKLTLWLLYTDHLKNVPFKLTWLMRYCRLSHTMPHLCFVSLLDVTMAAQYDGRAIDPVGSRKTYRSFMQPPALLPV